MMVDTAIYGYIREGDAVCAGCVAISEETNEPPEEWSPLYSIHDDWDEGLACGECSDYIFEPHPDYCFDCDTIHEEECKA